MNVALTRKKELITSGWKQSFSWAKTAANGGEATIPGWAEWIRNISFVSKNAISMLPFYQIMSKPGEISDFKMLAIFGNASQQSIHSLQLSGGAHGGPLFTLLDSMASWKTFHDGNQIGDRDIYESKSQEFKDRQSKYLYLTVSTQTQYLSDKYKFIEINTLYEIDTNVCKKYTMKINDKVRNMVDVESTVYRVTDGQTDNETTSIPSSTCQATPVIKMKFVFIQMDTNKMNQSYKKRNINPQLEYSDINSKSNINKIVKFKQDFDAAVAKYDQIYAKEFNHNQCELIPLSPFMQQVADPKHGIFGRFGIFMPGLVNNFNSVTSLTGYFVLNKIARGPKHGAQGGLIYSLLYETAMRIVEINCNANIRMPILCQTNKLSVNLICSEIKYKKLLSMNKLWKICTQIVTQVKQEGGKIEVQSLIFDPLNNQHSAVATFVFMVSKPNLTSKL